MSRLRRHFSILSVLATGIVAMTGCDGKVSVPSVDEIDIPSPDIDVEEYTEQIKDLYERAKAAGEQVPEDMLTWAKSDMKKIGTWDYKIETFSSASTEGIRQVEW